MPVKTTIEIPVKVVKETKELTVKEVMEFDLETMRKFDKLLGKEKIVIGVNKPNEIKLEIFIEFNYIFHKKFISLRRGSNSETIYKAEVKFKNGKWENLNKHLKSIEALIEVWK